MTRGASATGCSSANLASPVGVTARFDTTATMRSNSRALRAPACMEISARRVVLEPLSVPRSHRPTWRSAASCVREPRAGVKSRESLEMIDAARDARRAETVVDIPHGDAARAAIEHPEQRRDAVEAGAVADARRYGNHRDPHEPADDARQRTFHARHDNEHARTLESFVLPKEP